MGDKPKKNLKWVLSGVSDLRVNKGERNPFEIKSSQEPAVPDELEQEVVQDSVPAPSTPKSSSPEQFVPEPGNDFLKLEKLYIIVFGNRIRKSALQRLARLKPDSLYIKSLENQGIVYGLISHEAGRVEGYKLGYIAEAVYLDERFCETGEVGDTINSALEMFLVNVNDAEINRDAEAEYPLVFEGDLRNYDFTSGEVFGEEKLVRISLAEIPKQKERQVWDASNYHVLLASMFGVAGPA